MLDNQNKTKSVQSSASVSGKMLLLKNLPMSMRYLHKGKCLPLMLITLLIAKLYSTAVQSARGSAVLNGETKKCVRNPNKSSLLTHLPDYTYMDGRVTPFGVSRYLDLILGKHNDHSLFLFLFLRPIKGSGLFSSAKLLSK